MEDVKNQFEELSISLNALQNTISELADARTQLETQYQENKIVLEEFEIMSKDTEIFKQIGPILMPQEYDEALSNVKKRIEFIEGEIKRVEKKLDEEQKTMEETQQRLMKVRAAVAA